MTTIGVSRSKESRDATLFLAVFVFVLGGVTSWLVISHSPAVRAVLSREVQKVALQLGLAEDKTPMPRLQATPAPKPARPEQHGNPKPVAQASPAPVKPDAPIQAEAVIGNKRVVMQSTSKDIIVVDTH
jgi:hypothetical protein